MTTVALPRSPLGGLYLLFLRSQMTRGRLAALGGLAAFDLIVAFSAGRADTFDPTQTAAEVITLIGLSLAVPVATLIFASSVFGNLREDGSLVYLWLRPISRVTIVAAAYAAVLTATLPLVVVPLVLAAALTDGGSAIVPATAASACVGVAAYAALFLAVGLRVQRALVWGLAYILIWEGIVALVSDAAGRFAIASYTRSILTEVSATDLELAASSPLTSLAVPAGISCMALAYAVRRFQRQDIA